MGKSHASGHHRIATRGHWITLTGNVTPKALVSVELWQGGAPQWARDAWLEMQVVLGNSRGKSLWGSLLPRSDKPHWKPWVEWYQQRLLGCEDREDIELVFAMLPVDHPGKHYSEQNDAIATKVQRTEIPHKLIVPAATVPLCKDHGSSAPGDRRFNKSAPVSYVGVGWRECDEGWRVSNKKGTKRIFIG